MGLNANVAFYSWRLHATGTAAVTIVDPLLDPAAPIVWLLASLPAGPYTPSVAQSLAAVPRHEHDIVIVSVSLLQSYQEVLALLDAYVGRSTLLVLELTGYVKLEPFVAALNPKLKAVPVCLLMNEADVRRTGPNSFSHKVHGDNHRVYVGLTSGLDLKQFARLYQMLKLAQQDLKGQMLLLKLTAPKEFITYQWKLALPRIVLNALLVVFEEPFPALLARQILAKPLVTGLVIEVCKIIKKMECKLVKGFENEQNLLRSWLLYYPEAPQTLPAYANANTLFYNFYHKYDLELDLLLLQPILLGDDHGVRTPYLENLYLIVSQLAKLNLALSLVLFVRRSDEHEALEKRFGGLQLQMLQLELHEAQKQRDVAQLESAHEAKLRELRELQQAHEAKKREFAAEESLWRTRLGDLQLQIEQLRVQLEALQQHTPPDKDEFRDARTVPETPDLADLQAVAMYGAALNGEGDMYYPPQSQPKQALAQPQPLAQSQPQPQPQSQPQPQPPLQPQFQPQQAQPQFQGQYPPGASLGGLPLPDEYFGYNQNYASSQSSMRPYQQRSLSTGPEYDQRPPHGLPSNGFPQNALPSTLRNPQRYQGPNQGPGAGPGPNQGYYPQYYPNNPNPTQYPNGYAPVPGPGMRRGSVPNLRPDMGKKPRRSGLGINEAALHIDYGGRGGMPMAANSNTNTPATKAKHRLMMAPGMLSPPMQRKLFANAAPSQATQAAQVAASHTTNPNVGLAPAEGHLRPPQGTSQQTSLSLLNPEELPRPVTPESKDVRLDVPEMPPATVPEIEDKKKKKKKRFFKKN